MSQTKMDEELEDDGIEGTVLWTSEIRQKQQQKIKLTKEEADWIAYLEAPEPEEILGPVHTDTGVAVYKGKRLGVFKDWIEGLEAMRDMPAGTTLSSKHGILARRVKDNWLPSEAELDVATEDDDDENISDILSEIGIDL